MRTYYDERGRMVEANSYQQAAELLYGQATPMQNFKFITQVDRCSGYAKVYTRCVYKAQDNTVHKNKPVRHILRIKPTLAEPVERGLEL